MAASSSSPVLSVSFSDPAALQTLLREAHINWPNNDIILLYFSFSPFFDTQSINQDLLIQNNKYNIMAELAKNDGLQFVIDNDFNHAAPRLFVVNKIRKSGDEITKLEVYYYLDGVIMQAPQLLDLIRARFGKAAMHLQASFAALVLEDQPEINNKEEITVGIEI